MRATKGEDRRGWRAHFGRVAGPHLRDDGAALHRRRHRADLQGDAPLARRRRRTCRRHRRRRRRRRRRRTRRQRRPRCKPPPSRSRRARASTPSTATRATCVRAGSVVQLAVPEEDPLRIVPKNARLCSVQYVQNAAGAASTQTDGDDTYYGGAWDVRMPYDATCYPLSIRGRGVEPAANRNRIQYGAPALQPAPPYPPPPPPPPFVLDHTAAKLRRSPSAARPACTPSAARPRHFLLQRRREAYA